jgi:putative cell wall-binding protein
VSAMKKSLRRVAVVAVATLVVAPALATVASATSTFAFDRQAGIDRYATSVKVATTFGTSTSVILANGTNAHTVDALTAAYLAGVKHAPILLTQLDATPTDVVAAITATGATTVYIVGGTGVVSTAQGAALDAKFGTVTRLGGDDRFLTAEKVIAEAGAATSATKTAIVTTGMDFPDALGAGPLSYVKGMPIGITTQSALPDSTLTALKGAGVTNAIVLGGPTVVGQGVLDALVAGGISLSTAAGVTAGRIYGGDRAETSTKLADFMITSHGFSNTAVNVASGADAAKGADALGGAALSGKEVRPTLITGSATTAGRGLLEFLTAHAPTLASGHIFGGVGVVSAALATSMTNAATTAAPNQTVPGAPTGVVGTVMSDTSAAVSWTAPASNGGSTITGYKVIAHNMTTSTAAAAVTSTSGAAITGLTSGDDYTFTVVATNAVGDSAASAASTAILVATVPGAPTGVVGTVDSDTSAKVAWTAPASNGGSAITGYTVTPLDETADAAGTPVDMVSGATIGTLTNGHSYTFTVVATNAVGDSAASNPSTAILVATVPGDLTTLAPIALGVIDHDGSGTLSAGDTIQASFSSDVAVNGSATITVVNEAGATAVITQGATTATFTGGGNLTVDLISAPVQTTGTPPFAMNASHTMQLSAVTGVSNAAVPTDLPNLRLAATATARTVGDTGTTHEQLAPTSVSGSSATGKVTATTTAANAFIRVYNNTGTTVLATSPVQATAGAFTFDVPALVSGRHILVVQSLQASPLIESPAAANIVKTAAIAATNTYSGVVVTADTAGAAGNSIHVVFFISGLDDSTQTTWVTDNLISVSLATWAGGHMISNQNTVAGAINGLMTDPTAGAVTATVTSGNASVWAVGDAALSGGADTVYSAGTTVS